MEEEEIRIREESFKLGRHEPGLGPVQHLHSNVFHRESFKWGERLLVAPSGRHVDLMLRLAAAIPAPYSVLYVLLVARGEQQEGRYVLENWLDPDELEEFVTKYRDFFEGDARHHVWIRSDDRKSQIVYDQHDYLYLYGDLDRYEAILTNLQLRPGDSPLPIPHSHHYRSEFDETASDLLTNYPWHWGPLGEND